MREVHKAFLGIALFLEYILRIADWRFTAARIAGRRNPKPKVPVRFSDDARMGVGGGLTGGL